MTKPKWPKVSYPAMTEYEHGYNDAVLACHYIWERSTEATILPDNIDPASSVAQIAELKAVNQGLREKLEEAAAWALHGYEFAQASDFPEYPPNPPKWLTDLYQPPDDPASSPVGEVRRGPYGEIADRVYVVTGKSWLVRIQPGGASIWRDCGEVKSWPVIGAVPGTPADVERGSR